MSLYARYAALLDGVLDELQAGGVLPAELNRRPVAVEPPRDPTHGDLATNAAMVLAKAAGTNAPGDRRRSTRALATAKKIEHTEVATTITGKDVTGRLAR